MVGNEPESNLPAPAVQKGQLGERLWRHMFTGRTQNTIAIALMMLLTVLAVGCTHCRTSADGSRLALRLTGAKSPEEIEGMVRTSLLQKYSLTNVAEGYTMYHLTNGPTRWVFVQAANAPRGLGMFNLYCYERRQPDLWLLRGYVPVYTRFYTKSDDQHLDFQIDSRYVNVLFRGAVIFTVVSDRNAIGWHGY